MDMKNGPGYRAMIRKQDSMVRMAVRCNHLRHFFASQLRIGRDGHVSQADNRLRQNLSEKQAKKAIIDIGQRMYMRGFVAANDGNISVRTGENEVWATGAIGFSYHISVTSWAGRCYTDTLQCGTTGHMQIRHCVGVFISMVEVGAQTYTGTWYLCATAATTEVPILLAVSPLAATGGQLEIKCGAANTG